MQENVHTDAPRSDIMVLGEDTLVRLLDACFRGCIATRPTRLGRGIHMQGDRIGPSLCDIVPNVFNPDYAEKFAARVCLISGIAHFLSRSHLREYPASGHVFAPSYSTRPYQAITSSVAGPSDLNTHDIYRRHLWLTLANSLREYTSARKLCPLWCLLITDKKGSELQFCDLASTVDRGFCDLVSTVDRGFYDSVLNSGNSCQQPVVANGVRSGRDWGMSAIARGTEAQGCPVAWPMSDHISRQSSTSMEIMASLFHDSDDDGGVRDRASIAFPTTEISPSGPGDTRSRGEARPPDADVSRLMISEYDRGHHIGKRSVSGMLDLIGGAGPLTHGATRLHPLMHVNHSNQAGQAVEEVGREGLLEALFNVKDAPKLAAAEKYVVVSTHHDAEPGSRSHCSFDRLTDPEIDVASDITDISVISAIQDTIYYDDSADEDCILDELQAMASSQQERESRASLAELLGNEHLLWKMFQRRGSVAPQGEQDMDDMRRLYESDPDMKLFGPGWNLSPSDVSSSSNEDPMLQGIGPRHTPSAPSKPSTPTSEKRSYVGNARPTSSSSMGKQSTDPKYQRRGSLIKRFQWGGRKSTTELGDVEEDKVQPRETEVKRRRTLDDYDTMSLDDTSDESNEMLFR